MSRESYDQNKVKPIKKKRKRKYVPHKVFLPFLSLRSELLAALCLLLLLLERGAPFYHCMKGLLFVQDGASPASRTYSSWP